MKVTRDLSWSQQRGILNAREMGHVQKKYFVQVMDILYSKGNLNSRDIFYEINLSEKRGVFPTSVGYILRDNFFKEIVNRNS